MNPPTCYACLVLAVGVALLNRGGEAVDSRAPIKLEVMGADAGSDSSQSMELVLDGNDMLGYGDATVAAQFCESHFEGPDQRSECTSTLIAQIEQLRTNNLAAEAGAFYSRQTISTLSG